MRTPNGWTELAAVGAVVAMSSAFSGCGHRQHLTRTHGESTEQIMKAQAFNPNAGSESQPDLGLDSEEATIVAGSYHAGLAPGGKAAAEPQILVLSDEGTKGKPR